MNTPEEETRFAQAFDAFGEAAELMVEPPATTEIRRRVRRRRVTRVTVAAVAAIALAAPTSWMLQQVANADERQTPVADETSTEVVVTQEPTTEAPTPEGETTPETESPSIEDPPPTYDDLVGAAIELPSFHDEANEICPVAPAQLSEVGGDGPIYLIKVVHARLTADGPEQAVALVGCRPGEAMIRQVLVIEADGDGYTVAEQLYRYEFEVTASPYDIAPAADYGLLVGLIEQEPCCSSLPEHFDQWIERYRDGGSETLNGDVPGAYVTDLAPSIEVTDTGKDTWEVRVTVENAGGYEAAPFELRFCSNEGIRLEDGTTGACNEGGVTVETADGLGADDTYEAVWTVTADPKEEWSDEEVQYGQQFSVEVNMPRYGTDALVFETATGNNSQSHTFTYEDMD